MSSRHAIDPKQPGLTVVVGWDNPLMTFFAQVTRNRVKNGAPVLWIGGSPRECQDPQGLRAPLAPYAHLTDAQLAQLRADRAADADRGPSALQRFLLDPRNRGGT